MYHELVNHSKTSNHNQYKIKKKKNLTYTIRTGLYANETMQTEMPESNETEARFSSYVEARPSAERKQRTSSYFAANDLWNEEENHLRLAVVTSFFPSELKS